MVSDVLDRTGVDTALDVDDGCTYVYVLDNAGGK